MRRTLWIAAALASCGGEAGEVAPGAAEPATFHFVDASAESGLRAFRHTGGSAEKAYIIESFGAGVALVDYDRDGDLDAYLTNGAPLDGPPVGDALFANDGRGRFTRVNVDGIGDASWTYGVRVADVDGDGWPDLYLTNRGPNVLLRNEQGRAFRDVTDQLGVGDPGWSTGAVFFDPDRDGDLDLYVVNHIEFDRAEIDATRKRDEYLGQEVYFGPHGLQPQSDRYYENTGALFVDRTEQAGVGDPPLYGFQAVVFDHDGDGRPDVYVANDSRPNVLWLADGTGFRDVALQIGAALSMEGGPQAGMGVAVGDANGDLLPDLYVTNFSEDYFTLYLRDKRGFYADKTAIAGLRGATLSSLGWGCGFHDFDQDGDLDVWAVNGHVFPQMDAVEGGPRYRQRNQVFENLGDGRFRAPPGGGGPGFALEEASRGAAVGDVDGDGDLDLLVGNLDASPSLLRNEGPVGEAVRVVLVGKGQNTDAIGARVVGRSGARAFLRLAGTQAGFLSSDEPALHFGLGAATQLDTLEITWPDGTLETLKDVAAGQTVTVRQGEGVVERVPFVAR